MMKNGAIELLRAGESRGEGARADQGGGAEGQEAGNGLPEPLERAQRERGVCLGGCPWKSGGGARVRSDHAGIRAGPDFQRVRQGKYAISLFSTFHSNRHEFSNAV